MNTTANDHTTPGALPHDLPLGAFGVHVPIPEAEPDTT